MKKRLTRILFLLLILPVSLAPLSTFSPYKGWVLAQTCQDNDSVCPEGCTPEDDNNCCGSIRITISPKKETYETGDVVNIKISGLAPEYENNVTLHYTRTSANTQNNVWTEIPLSYIPPIFGNYWRGNWTIPNSLPYDNPYPNIDPYGASENQEFFLAMTLIKDSQFLCSGNPDPGVIPGHPEIEQALCENCYEVLVTKDEPAGDILDMSNFWNAVPGYSFTYEGERLDDPLDDDGQPIIPPPTFITRMEYETPIELCDGLVVIPQRFTKSNRWGYWNPANPDPSQRTDMWTKGEHNLRFLITSPKFEYSWDDTFFGSVGHKYYKQGDLTDSPAALGTLGTFDGTMMHSTLGYENYYYPPYLLSLSQIPDSDLGKFIRIDSIYRIWDNGNTEEKEKVCNNTRQKKENHQWYARFQLLTDAEVKSEFSQILGYFPNPETRKVAVITFFESTAENLLIFREDWYLAENIGLVGIDQALWDKSDTAKAELYFNTPFMKRSEKPDGVYPHMTIRAKSAYLGESLTINTSPTAVSPGGSYTLTAHSIDSGAPYDGQLEYNNEGIHLWKSAIDGKPMWVENGSVVVELPEDFPAGEHTASFRPYITRSPSDQETVVPPSKMPWSNEITVTVRLIGDLDHDGDMDNDDIKVLLSHYNTANPEVDLNKDGIVNGLDFGEMVKLVQ